MIVVSSDHSYLDPNLDNGTDSGIIGVTGEDEIVKTVMRYLENECFACMEMVTEERLYFVAPMLI